MKLQVFSFACLLLFTSAWMLTGCEGEAGEQDINQVKTVTLEGKIWMAENLSIGKFRNGDPIPHAADASEWRKAGEQGKPAWCFYNNDPANEAAYGRLYNWFAVTDPRGLAPVGWHVPTDAEWTAMTESLGDNAGAKIKSKEWKGGQGSNETGFNGLPGGNRNHDGSFHLINNYGVWWSASAQQGNYAWFRFVTSINPAVGRDYSNKAKGLSVRLVKDQP